MTKERYNIFATEDKWQKIWGFCPQPALGIDLKNLRQKTLDDIVKKYAVSTPINLTEINATIVNFSADDTINDIIESYGSDVIRLFLFDSDPNKDFIWNDDMLDGSWRFVKKIWHQVTENLDRLPPVEKSSTLQRNYNIPLYRTIHATIISFTNSLNSGDFNLCVARLRELSNQIAEFKNGDNSDDLRHALETLLYLMAPITPHLNAECWQLLGHKTNVFDIPWPETTSRPLTDETTSVAVHINGKLQGYIQTPANTGKKLIEEIVLSDPETKKSLNNKSVNKVVIIDNKMINLVTA